MTAKHIDRNPLTERVSFSAAQEKSQKPKTFIKSRFLKILVVGLLLAGIASCSEADDQRGCGTSDGTISCPK